MSGLQLSAFHTHIKTWAMPAPQHSPALVREASLILFLSLSTFDPERHKDAIVGPASVSRAMECGSPTGTETLCRDDLLCLRQEAKSGNCRAGSGRQSSHWEGRWANARSQGSQGCICLWGMGPGSVESVRVLKADEKGDCRLQRMTFIQ